MPYYPAADGGSGPETGSRYIQCTLAKQGPDNTWITPQGMGIIQDSEFTNVTTNSQTIELTINNSKSFGVIDISFLELSGFTGLVGTATPTGIGGNVSISIRRYNGNSYDLVDPTSVIPSTFIQFGMWIER